MIWFSVNTNDGDTLFKSKISSFKDAKEKIFQYGNKVLKIETNDVDLVKSNRLYSKIGPITINVFEQLYESFREQIEAQAHTLKKIQAQLSQKIEQIVESPLSNGKYSYSEQKELISKAVLEDPQKTAEVLIYLNKRISELNAHMSSFELIHMGEFIKLDKQRHNIRRLILNIWHAFDGQFYKKNIRYNFNFQDSYADENKLYLDYNTINTAFYNFFDNCSKYVLPDSEIKINYKVEDEKSFTITILMESFLIKTNELSRVFDLGFRCDSCLDVEGSGVGLHVFKKVLEMHGFEVKMKSNGEVTFTDKKNKYSKNTFIITGNLS